MKNIVNNLFETKLKKASDTVRMTEAERVRMREILAEYQGFNPIRSFNKVELENKNKRAPFFYNLFHDQKRAVALGLVVFLVFSGSGVSYAAEGSLPGDTLYPLKVNVNEEIWSAFSFSDEAKVEWETERAERRLEEATTLAGLGNIREEVAIKIADNFEAHASRVVEHVTKLEMQAPQRAQELRENFDVAVSAHAMVLRRLGTKVAETISASTTDGAIDIHTVINDLGGSVEESVRVLIARVEGRGHLASSGRVLLVESVKDVEGNTVNTDVSVLQEISEPVVATSEQTATTATNTDTVYFETRIDTFEVVALRLGKKVAEEISRIKSTLPSAKKKLTAEDFQQAEAYLAGIEAMYKNAVGAGSSGEYETALKIYQKVFPHAIRLRVWLSAGVMFEVPSFEELEETSPAVVLPEPKSNGPIPVPYPNTGSVSQRVETGALTLTRTFKGGVHMFRGTVITPTPCHTVDVKYAVAESFPEQITLHLSTLATNEICIQVLGKKEFSVDVKGVSESASLTGVFVDGKKIDLELGGTGGDIKLRLKEDGGGSSSIRIKGTGSEVNISNSSGEGSVNINNSVNVKVNTGGNSLNGEDGADGADGEDGKDGGVISVGAGSVKIEIDTNL